MSALPIGVLASGGGTNLQALIDTVHGREATIAAVATDTPGAQALDRAEAAGLPTGTFPLSEHPDRERRDAALADWLQERGVRLVVLAGWMTLLTPVLLDRFPGAVINVHPSLLPAFTGLRAVQQAVERGVRVIGVTVHFVDEGVDTGQIILQGATELPPSADADEALALLRPLEHTLLPEAVRLLARGAVRLDPANPRRTLIDP
jgi:phosphoribosylglycinamide formyltransferase-1